MVNEKKLDGVSDLRDESDRDGIRVVIELKRDAIAAVVQNNLFKKTALQVSFSGNMLALTNKGTEPQRVTLREGLKVFIAYRFETLRRRTAFKLHKCEARDHLVQGMLKALKSIDDIVAIMTKSKDAASAKDILMSDKYGFSAEQVICLTYQFLRK